MIDIICFKATVGQKESNSNNDLLNSTLRNDGGSFIKTFFGGYLPWVAVIIRFAKDLLVITQQKMLAVLFISKISELFSVLPKYFVFT